jgi:hypothetical protein
MRFFAPGSALALGSTLTLGSALTCGSLCVALWAAPLQDQSNQQPPSAGQPSAGSDQRRAGGEKSITGCLMRGDRGFVVKTQEGTYELNTDRDLSAYLGKQIRIESKWDATGTLTNSPMETGSVSGSAAPAAPAQAAGTPAPAFVGDLHLHITGTVLGDCATPK